MNRLTTRLTAAAAGLAACGLVLTGCSSGQISQTASQESAVNGTSANLKNIALRNVHLQTAQTGDFVQPGTVVPLVLVAANNSPDVAEAEWLLSRLSPQGLVYSVRFDEITFASLSFDFPGKNAWLLA